MNIYAIDKLMSKTRQLAAEYRRLTGQVLPVSNELSRHDVITRLNFIIPEKPESGVDLVGVGSWEGKKILVKSRVVFTNSKSRPRLGQLNFDGKWDLVALVLMNEDYIAEEIYMAKKEVLLDSLKEHINSKSKDRNTISVAKFKVLGELIWSKQEESLAQS